MNRFNYLKSRKDFHPSGLEEIETEILYTNILKSEVIEGIDFPLKWQDFSDKELVAKARYAIVELSETSNQDFRARELGFHDAKHLINFCFNYVLK
ncbi:MAG TPA: hypothetical protein EYG89_05265 [Bacteroidia bacterium]|nr:hypothetical protein [Bacteroidia bacterium]